MFVQSACFPDSAFSAMGSHECCDPVLFRVVALDIRWVSGFRGQKITTTNISLLRTSAVLSLHSLGW